MFRHLVFAGVVFAALPLAAQAPNPTPLRPGTLSLALDPLASSSLAIDEGELDNWLCGTAEPPDLPQNGGTEDCRLLIGGGNLPILDLSLESPEPFADGGAQMMAEVSGLGARGQEPFSSRCGDWTWTLKLHPSAPSRPLPFHFLPPVEEEPTALFVGSLAFTAEITFAPHNGEASRVLPWPLDLDLAGRWLVLPAEALEEGQTNLTLLVGFSPLTQGFVAQPTPAHGLRRCDRLELQAEPESVALANLHLP